MKRHLLFLVLFAKIVASAFAAPTAKAIYCAENTTLYFTYDEATYAAGTVYDNLDGKKATAVYTNIRTTGYAAATGTAGDNLPWKSYISVITTVKFLENFIGWEPTNLGAFFAQMTKLSTIIGGEYLNTENVTSLRLMFYKCSSLTNLDFLSTWNTKNVTDLFETFRECESLTDINGLENWDVSKVETMYRTFFRCSFDNVNALKKWNVSSVKNFTGTFMQLNRSSPNRNFNVEGLVNWDTSSAETMATMFAWSGIESVDPLEDWDVSNVWDMATMFDQGNMDNVDALSGWDTRNLVDMSSIFAQCNKLSNIEALSNWNTSKVHDASQAFLSTAITNVDALSTWNTTNMCHMQEMFENCFKLTNIEGLRNWDTSKVKFMFEMFSGCESLTSIEPIYDWNTENSGGIGYMFNGCKSLTGVIDLSKWDFSNFEQDTRCDCQEYDTHFVNPYWYNCRGLSNTFFNCPKITGVILGKGNVAKTAFGENMRYSIFTGDENLRFIDFSGCTDEYENIIAVNREEGQFYTVPLTTVIYLPKGNTKPESGDVTNVVYTDGTDLKCDEYYSEDKVDIEFPHDFLTPKAIYTRNISTTYGSVILPYEFKTNDNIFAFTLNEEHPETMYFLETPTVPAHTPFAFKKRKDLEDAATTLGVSDEKTKIARIVNTYVASAEEKTKEFGNTNFSMISDDGSYSITVKATNTTSASEKTVSGDTGTPYVDVSAAITDEAAELAWTTKGYYVNETVNDYSGTFYIAGDKFYKADGALTLYPHRVTFHGAWTKGDLAGSATGAKDINFTENDVVTAIEAAEAREAEKNEIYDMQGRRMSKLNRGMNIVRMSDGSVRKIMVK